MGEVIYLYPDANTVDGVPGSAETDLCPNFEPSGFERKSWIYHESPGICGRCSSYRPEAGYCRKLKFKVECVCLSCGDFCLDRPGAVCSKCGHTLAAVTIPSDW